MSRDLPGYRLDVPLPPGRLGAVQSAIRLSDRLAVAVHLVDVRLDATSRRRFRARTDELRATAGDPHVVPLLDAGIVGNKPYLVTPRADRSVAELLKAHGPLPVPLVVDAGRAAVAALAAYERAGLRHGNVTPANLLMRADSGIGLTGAAIDVLDELAGAHVGPHRPPEELRGEIDSAGAAADVYAVGSTLWTLLAGSPPFGDGTDVALRLRGAYPANLLRSDVPEPLLALVRSMLSADPALRPGGLAALAAALKALTANAVPAAAPLGDVLATVPPADPGGRGPFDPPSGELAIGPGVQLLGNYEVIRSKPLGAGVSGTVYRGVDRSRRDPVAVKILHETLRDGPDETRFRREARALAETVGHPNLVRIRDLVVQDRHLAIVMDLVEGGDLAKLVERETLTPERTCQILRDVAAALRYLHQARVIHRDVKPRNVLVEPGQFGLAKLSDLSVARSLDDNTITGAGLVGTRPYAAPEVVRGEPASFASDVYSFGIMAYELFAGRRPLRSTESARRPPGAETARPVGISDQAWHLLSVCLAEDPHRRPNAARLLQMVKALPETTGDGGKGFAGDDDEAGRIYAAGDAETHDPSEEPTLDDDWTGGGRRRQPPRHGQPKPDAHGGVPPAVPSARRGARPAERPAWVRLAPVPLFLLVFGLVFVLVHAVLPPDGPGPDIGPGPAPSTSSTGTAAAGGGYVALAVEAVSGESGIVTLSWPQETWVRPRWKLKVTFGETEQNVDAPASGTIDEQISNAGGEYCFTVRILVETVTIIPPTRIPPTKTDVCLAADGANVARKNYP